MKYPFIIITLLLSVHYIFGQSESGLGLYISSGKVIKHRESFAIDPSTEQSWQYGLRFQSRSFSPDHWRKRSGYPTFTLDVMYSHFGVNEVYGESISFFPGLTFHFNHFYIRTGLGIAYLNSPYDEQLEVPNTAIGSKLNSIAQLQLGWEYAFNQWKLFLEGGITHYSNVGIKKPNLGLNYLGITSGIRFNFNPINQENTPIESTPVVRRFLWGMKYAIGYFDYDIASEDEIHHYSWAQSIAFNAAYKIGLHQPFISTKYTRNRAQELRNGEENIWTWSISIGHEFRLGRIGAFLAAGIYLSKNYHTPYAIPSEFGINYYINPRLFIGLNMKNHLIIAEYPELSLGGWF